MEREINSQLKQIQSNIKQVLTNNKIETTPENIIRYTAQTIIQLKDNPIIPHLFSVIFVYKDFIMNTDTVSSLAINQLNTYNQERVLRLIKIMLNNDKHSVSLFKNLLEVFYKTNDKKIRNVLEMFNIKEEYARSLSDDVNFIRMYNLFFNSLIDKIEFKDRLTHMKSRYSYNLLLKYTNYIIDGPTIDKENSCELDINNMLSMNQKEKVEEKPFDEKVEEKPFDEKVKELNYILNTVILNKDYAGFENNVIKIINKIFEFNNLNFLKTKVHVIELTKEVKDFINDLITNKDTDIELAQEFFSINRLYIVPHFIQLIRNITSDKLLQYIVSAVDIEILTQIIKLDANLLKFSTNNDIELFLRLYEQDNNMINAMPTFLDFCTDHQNLIVKFSDLISMKITSDFFVICTAIRNILRSHELNLNKECILRNMIPKAQSENIIKELTKYEIFKLIITNYQCSAVVNDLLFLMTKYIKNLENEGRALFNEISKGETGNAHLFKFFIPSMNIDLDIISKILEECRNKNDNQKKFYEILYHLEKNGKINIDICSELYALDMMNNLQAPSRKWRIQYLHLRFKKGCCQKSDCCRINFLNALILNFNLGNRSCKEVSESILEELMLSDTKNMLLRFIEDNIKSNDINLRFGSLQAFDHLLKCSTNNLQIDYMRNIYDYLLVIYKDVNALIIIKLLTNYILCTEEIVTKEVVEIIEYYIDNKQKKYRKDIKNLVSIIIGKKSFDINRRIKQYYKFKIKTDNEEIIIKKK